MRDHVPVARLQHEAERLDAALDDRPSSSRSETRRAARPTPPARSPAGGRRATGRGTSRPDRGGSARRRGARPRPAIGGSAASSFSCADAIASPRPSSAAGPGRPPRNIACASGGVSPSTRVRQPSSELEAARRAALDPDRHAGGAQLVDVAVDGAHRDLQLVGERLRAHPAARLQQHQDREEAAGAHARSYQKYMT